MTYIIQHHNHYKPLVTAPLRLSPKSILSRRLNTGTRKSRRRDEYLAEVTGFRLVEGPNLKAVSLVFRCVLRSVRSHHFSRAVLFFVIEQFPPALLSLSLFLYFFVPFLTLLFCLMRSSEAFIVKQLKNLYA